MQKIAEGENNKYSKRYRCYVLLILFITYVFNFIDRNIISVLLQPIKLDLNLTNTQMGLLTGFAFALFYTLAGFPIARLADRTSRKSVIAVGLGLWSLMTAASGFAQNYTQLLLARMGVGIGEAAGVPPAHSLISDYFPKNERARALSIFSLGIFVGLMLSFVAAGWMAENYGWRFAFVAVGLPGLLLALLVQFTIDEPTRGAMDQAPITIRPTPLKIALSTILSDRAFLLAAFGGAFIAYANYAVVAWGPSFLTLVHGLGVSEAGATLGPILGLFGAIGMLLGGYFGDKIGQGDPWKSFAVPFVATALSIPCLLIFFFSKSLMIGLASYSLGVILINMHLAPVFALIQNIMAPQTRATSSAIFLIMVNILGVGSGPFVTGLIFDNLEPSKGHDALIEALAFSMVPVAIGALCFLGGWRNSAKPRAFAVIE